MAKSYKSNIPVLPKSSTCSIGTLSYNAVEITTTKGNKVIIDDCFLQYLEMVSQLLGIITYDDFSKMSESDRKSAMTKIFRELKLKEILC